MNYEKLYKEALERAKKVNKCESNDREPGTSLCEYIFPELKKSDERIRKELIDAIQGLWDNDALPLPLTTKRKDEWIAWLEKQGEKKYDCSEEGERIRKSLIDMLKNDEKCYLKEIAWLEKQVPIDKDKVVKGVRQGVALSIMNYLDRNTLGMCLSSMECADLESAVVDSDWSKVYDYMKMKLEKQVEAKFKIEDWICNGGGNPCKVNDVFGNYYDLCSIKGYAYNKPISDIDANYHLWSIEDAKDGDVLASGQVVFRFKMIHGVWLNCYCSLHNDGSFIADSYDLMTEKYFSEIYPATKEQRDTLERAITNAGYRWDKEKLKLEKI